MKHPILIMSCIFLLVTSCKTAKLVKVLNQGSVSEVKDEVSVPFEYRMGLMIIPVQIKGKTYDFLVDTGAPNVVSKELAAELGLKAVVSQSTGDSQGGSADLDFVELDTVTIAGVSFMHTGAAVADLGQSAEVGCLDVDGFIGSNLMKRLIWEIDYDKQLITMVADRSKLVIPAEHITLPFKPATSGTPKVTLKYNGIEEKNVTFDTGANSSFAGKASTYYSLREADPAIPSNYGFGRNASGLYGSNGADSTYYTQVNVTVGEKTFADQVVKFSSTHSRIMGNEFLGNFRVILDWSKKEVILVNNKVPEPESLTGFGFSANKSGDKLIIGFLVNGSDADKAGLKPGDRILQIGDKDYSVLTEELYCSILYDGMADKAAQKLRVRVESNGEVKELELERRKNVMER